MVVCWNVLTGFYLACEQALLPLGIRVRWSTTPLPPPFLARENEPQANADMRLRD